jgi:ribosomal protein L11 methyltransferase
MSDQWREISVVVSQEAADIVSDKLIELGSNGTVFEDIEEHPERCRIKAYYPVSSDYEDIIGQFQKYLGELSTLGLNVGEHAEIVSAMIDSADWSTTWKKYFKPTKIGKHVVVKPSWEPYTPQPDDIIIEIDPGMAFGSGLHPTTQLVIELLEQYMRPESSILDVGVGSGILSIAAACLGADSVLGLDVDSEAVAIARENIQKNAQYCRREPPIDERIELKVGSIDTLDIAKQFDCIVMNIRPNIILPLVPYAATCLRMGGALIISGILEEEGGELIAKIRTFDFRVQNHLSKEGWIAYILSQI